MNIFTKSALLSLAVIAGGFSLTASAAGTHNIMIKVPNGAVKSVRINVNGGSRAQKCVSIRSHNRYQSTGVRVQSGNVFSVDSFSNSGCHLRDHMKSQSFSVPSNSKLHNIWVTFK